MATTTQFIWASVALLILGGFVVLAVLPGVARRRRQAAIRRQIALTDALDSALGPVVAPIVTKPLFGPWRIEIAVPLDRPMLVGRLLGIAHRSLGAGGLGPNAYHIILIAQPRTDDVSRRSPEFLASPLLSA